MTRNNGRTGRWGVCAALLASVLIASLTACSSPWSLGDWPKTSKIPVATLQHPTVETKIAAITPGVSDGYRFVAFGDQRALADGEWQAIMKVIGRLAEEDDRLLFMVDTGDIVSDGNHSDQFAKLTDILSDAPELPYIVGVGNHEKNNNRTEVARNNTAVFLRYLADDFDENHMYYRKDIGPVRFLMLDTNDFVYGDDGTADKAGVEEGSRGEAQLKWLTEELSPAHRDDAVATIAVLHHPFIQTSTRHRSAAIGLWSMAYGGRTLPDILIDGGVDIVLAGHTHTYERLKIQRKAGGELVLINLSGRPRPQRILWAKSPRRARDVHGEEAEWFREKDWKGLDRWTITQEDAMVEQEANQFGLFTVEPDGGILLEMFFLDDEASGGVRRDPPVRLR